jgi:hypothetical protein
MNRNMPATGEALSSPNTFSRSDTTWVALPERSGNTPTDMPLSQSTSKISIVRR